MLEKIEVSDTAQESNQRIPEESPRNGTNKFQRISKESYRI